MKNIHVECKPDETLVRHLGFTQKFITHHSGKSRVFKKLSFVSNELAIVDEDPGTIKTYYEKGLTMINEAEGVTQYTDNNQNTVLILKKKLEDWILEACKMSKINVEKFGLPGKANDLHEIVNDRIKNFEKLINHLMEQNSSSILTLKEFLR